MRPEDDPYRKPEEWKDLTPTPIKIDIIHADWQYDIKISNDNTKGEKRVTIHVRSDGNFEDAQRIAHKMYLEELGS